MKQKKNRKIVIFNAYYYPEIASSMYLEKDIAEGFARAGFDVEMYVPLPTRGISDAIRKEYQEKKKEIQEDGHLVIHRYWLPKEKKNPLFRAFRYFMGNLQQFRFGLFAKKVDAFFCGSTPPTQGWITGMVAKLRRIPFVYNLHDIFPDSLVNAGLTSKGSLLWAIGHLVEKQTYRCANRIIVITDSMKKNLLSKGVQSEKIEVIPNWADLDSTIPYSRSENPLFDELGIRRDDFIVVYAGNFGETQGAEIVIEAAQRLEKESRIHFVIFGGGSCFEEAKVKAEKMSNVSINLLLPPERTSEVYSMGDVALVTCRTGVGNSAMPSKVWSIMACNTPIIASYDTDSELAKVLNESQTGICVEAENVEKLTNAILDMANRRLRIAEHGRDYVIEKASKKNVNKYVQTVCSAIEG